MSSILTSMVEIESLETISLSKPILAMDNNPNNSPIVKGRQDSSYSLRDSSKNKFTLEDYSTEISPTSNTRPTLT
jgi:hypothetical protein